MDQTLLFKTIVKQLQPVVLNSEKNPAAATSDITPAPRKKIEDIKFTADGDMKNQILTLDLQPTKTVDPDKYKSDKILEPKSEADRQKYFMIYGEFVTKSFTQQQLAKKYNYSVTHISRIIKWSSFQIGKLDNDANLQVMVDANKTRLQEIADVKKNLKTQLDSLPEKYDDPKLNPKDIQKKNEELDKRRSVLIGDISKCWKAEHQVNRLISQIEGLMSTAVIQVNDHRSVNYQMNSGFERKTGSELPGNDAKKIGAGTSVISPLQPASDIKSGSQKKLNTPAITNVERKH
jgi:hypothetical protein